MTNAVPTTQHDCDIRLHRGPNGPVITVDGILDWFSAAELIREAGRAERQPRLVIDLSSARRLDSAGSGALIHTILAGRRAGQQMAVVAIDEVAGRLDALGIGEVVPVFPTRAAAEAFLRFPPGA